MAHTHYLDIMMREGGIAHELHARLLLGVHYRNVAGDALAVAWPDWRARPGEFGLLFRAFGTPDHLRDYAETIRPLVAAGLVREFPVQVVPDVSGFVMFVRERHHDKLSPSAARRLEKRANARGDTWTSKSVHEQRQDHYLTIPSTTSGQTFRLYLKRSSSNATSEQAGRSYGLGVALPDF